MLPRHNIQERVIGKEFNSWICKHCPSNFQFGDAEEFARHLRESHSIKEGGSYICRYGNNSVCASLPLEGVSDRDYKDHIMKKHVMTSSSSSTDFVKSLGIMEYSSRPDSPSLSAASRISSPRTTIGLNTVRSSSDTDTTWTVFDSTQNLAAVLNDPRLMKRESDFFTKTWGVTFIENVSILPPPHLPVISSQLFKSYLKKTSKRTKQLKSLAVQSQQTTGTTGENSSRSLAAILERNRSCIEVVPKVFLTTPFELENQETFNQVLPWSQISSDSDSASKSSVKLLQEKLSHYLDVVEVQIARQISLKSEAFFQAMTSHDALMEQLTKNIQAVKYLRRQISCIDDVLVKKAFQCLKMRQTRNNCHLIYNKLKLMSTVHQTQPTVQLLLATSEFAGALDLIATTKDIAEQELVGIHCFRHLNSQLAEIEIVIDKMMQADFVRHISTRLNRPFPPSDASNGYQTEEEEFRIQEEEHLISIVFGMLRLNKFEFVDVFQEESKTAVKAIVKQTEIETICKSDHDDIEKDSAGLINQISKLEFNLWLELLNKVFANLLLLLRRIQSLQVVMIDIVDVAAGTPLSTVEEYSKVNSSEEGASANVDGEKTPSSSILSHSEHMRLTKSLKDAMVAVCDQASERCVRILSQRSASPSNSGDNNEVEKMRVADFINLAKCIETFIRKSGEFAGKPTTQLKLALQSMSTKFTLRFHKEKSNKLSNILNSEQWKQADVPVGIQKLVYTLENIGTPASVESDNQLESGKAGTQVYLLAGDQKYAVVGTVLLLLSIISEYCDCALDVPIVGQDMARNLVELLKFYNSRTCQLILGAGALQLVGLKTITTKNLALASRSLQLMVHFIPIVKTQFEVLISDKEKPVIKNFDHVLRDYNHHINEISNKFVGIMDDKIESLLSKWEVRAPVPSPAFRSISKHLSKLHEAVADLLPEPQLREIFRRIHLSFKEKLKTHLVRLKVNSDGGPQHGLVTQELTFYTENLKILNIFPEGSNQIEDLFFTNPYNANNNVR